MSKPGKVVQLPIPNPARVPEHQTVSWQASWSWAVDEQVTWEPKLWAWADPDVGSKQATVHDPVANLLHIPSGPDDWVSDVVFEATSGLLAHTPPSVFHKSRNSYG